VTPEGCSRAAGRYGEAVGWTLGGALLVAASFAILLNLWGAANALWRFWASEWATRGLPPRKNPCFVRRWFGGLLVVTGAGWIYAGL
jgi:hypothetical protein